MLDRSSFHGTESKLQQRWIFDDLSKQGEIRASARIRYMTRECSNEESPSKQVYKDHK
jgi:hypothetical protein